MVVIIIFWWLLFDTFSPLTTVCGLTLFWDVNKPQAGLTD
jgi:hypothetical protein